MQRFGIDFARLLRGAFEVLFNDFRSDGDNVLALPVLDQTQRLQCADNVLGFDGGHGADVFDREIAAVFLQNLEQHLGPVRSEAKQTQI